MRTLFTTLKGILIIMQAISLIVNFIIFGNSIAVEPRKENDYT